MFPTLMFSDDERRTLAVGEQSMREGRDLFRKHGCMLVKQAFDLRFIEPLRQEYLDRYRAWLDDREYDDALKVGHRRTMITVELTGSFNTPYLYANPLAFPLLCVILGKDCILGSLGSVAALPGSEDQHVHRDHPHIFLNEPQIIPVLPPYAVTMIIPLVPLNDINGTTRMWPGSHLANNAQTKLIAPLDPVADAGDCLLMDYRLQHGGTANRSDQVRPILYNVYNRAWFRDVTNYDKQDPLLVVSDEEFAKVPAPLSHLFSWARGKR